MVEFEPAIKSLTAAEVDFVIIGGLAVSFHSSGYVTKDLNLCYQRTQENLRKIVSAFKSFTPRLRGFPDDLPFVCDERTLQNGTNFGFQSEIGEIDMLGEVAGIGNYVEVEKHSISTKIYDCDIKILNLEGLIKAKSAARRTKDLLALPELEALQELLSETKD